MTSREERNQRIRIGITGLAFVFLLVVVGTAMSEQGREAAEPVEPAVAEEQGPPTDPLTEIGVAPGQAPVEESTPAPKPSDSDDAVTEALRDDLAGRGAREDIVEE